MLVILIPSAFEAGGVLARLEGREDFRVGEAECARGALAGQPALVGIIGMGPPHAARRAERVIQEARSGERGAENADRGPRNADDETRNAPLDGSLSTSETQNSQPETTSVRGVILCGFAGALKPGLKRGDLFLTAGAEHLLPLLPENARPPAAPLHTAEKIVPDAAAKAALHAQFGAWLVDMEQAQIAAVAAAAGLPLLGVRIVSDEAHEDLPHELLEKAYDQASGTQTPWKLAGHLTRNPFRIGRLAAFLQPLPSLRTRMSDRLHTWLTLAGSRLFR